MNIAKRPRYDLLGIILLSMLMYFLSVVPFFPGKGGGGLLISCFSAFSVWCLAYERGFKLLKAGKSKALLAFIFLFPSVMAFFSFGFSLVRHFS